MVADGELVVSVERPGGTPPAAAATRSARWPCCGTCLAPPPWSPPAPSVLLTLDREAFVTHGHRSPPHGHLGRESRRRPPRRGRAPYSRLAPRIALGPGVASPSWASSTSTCARRPLRRGTCDRVLPLGDGRWRALLDCMVDRDVSRLLIIVGARSATDVALFLATSVVAYDIGGPAAVGVVGAVKVLPSMVTAGSASLVADRVRRPLVIAGVNACFVVVALALAAGVLLDLGPGLPRAGPRASARWSRA